MRQFYSNILYFLIVILILKFSHILGNNLQKIARNITKYTFLKSSSQFKYAKISEYSRKPENVQNPHNMSVQNVVQNFFVKIV